MNKKLIDTYNGKIVNKYLPEVFDGYQFKDEEETEIIGIDVNIGDKIIKLIKSRYSNYANLLVGDEVLINEYQLIEPYENHINSIKKYIDNHYSFKTKEERIKMFEQVFVTEEDFNKNPKALIDYEIIFEMN